ncbi:MAG: tRNA uracil 4-sulfurtransferase ThiI [Candidatus Micrarchaeota archaeon]
MPDSERVINIHYGEIALKGKNRAAFERRLMDNISVSLSGIKCGKVRKIESRLVLPLGKAHEGEVLVALSRVFGIEWFAPALLVPNKIASMQNAIFSLAAPFKEKTMKLETSRSDKSYPLKSPDISRKLGMAMEEGGFSIDIRNPDEIITIEVLKGQALVSAGRRRGPGGLPVGSSGKLLSLLSGGIDSPVASYLMMKRGCSVDFLHFHSFAKNAEAEKSKMGRLAKQLRLYSDGPMRMFIAPYSEFYKKSFDLPPRIELVLFRRFILRLGSRLAEEHGHLGLVTGDSVGQVASQTLENLRATTEAATCPVYRPLVSFDKQEIINLAKRLGTYEISIEEYKDCCSLVAQKHPNTKVRLEAAKKAEEEIKIDEVIEKTLKDIKIIEI